MFDGSPQSIARIAQVRKIDGIHRLTLTLPAACAAGLKPGSRVAIDGVCLQVAAMPGGQQADFDLPLPMRITSTLAIRQAGDLVNIERARPGAGEGSLSGHVDYQARIEQIFMPDDGQCLRLTVPAGALRYLHIRGRVALDGVHLIIKDIDKQASWFEVWLTPDLHKRTTLGNKQAGEPLNLEIKHQTQTVFDTRREALEEKLSALRELLGPQPTLAHEADWATS